ncbi:hypothetical protein RND81_03G215400 [Saponaria officinalis]|uniref:C2 domain-containing protein n=1 Tax=Saponaria officinalis TaxID=3572 RepID=A0AAW1MA06_SAPOF
MENSASPTHLLEINLISAQNLKQPSTSFRRLQTYAVVYVDKSMKLRTRIDRVGGENPTWNDKFIFRVTDEFLRRETAAVTVDICAVGVLKDALLGSVRFLISNVISPATNHKIGVPAFRSVQIRRNSGRFQGILNVGAAVIDGGDIGSLSTVSAIGYVDMMGEVGRKHRRNTSHWRGKSEMSFGSESWGGDSVEFSDETESTRSTNSSSTTTSCNALREMSVRRDLAGEEAKGTILCGLGFQKKGQNGHFDDVVKGISTLDLNSG